MLTRRIHWCILINVLRETPQREKQISASGSVVEYRLAKARVAGSNPVSRSNLGKDFLDKIK